MIGRIVGGMCRAPEHVLASSLKRPERWGARPAGRPIGTADGTRIGDETPEPAADRAGVAHVTHPSDRRPRRDRDADEVERIGRPRRRPQPARKPGPVFNRSGRRGDADTTLRGTLGIAHRDVKHGHCARVRALTRATVHAALRALLRLDLPMRRRDAHANIHERHRYQPGAISATGNRDPSAPARRSSRRRAGSRR